MPNPNIIRKENPKYVWVIEYWNLRFVCNLVLGIWDLGSQILVHFRHFRTF